jgi:hypothetical protein
MSGNPFLQPDSPGSASRSKTIVRQKYVARQPSQEDYFDPVEDDVHGDFSEFEGNEERLFDFIASFNFSIIFSCFKRNSSRMAIYARV